jgi:hypothetical protein
MFTSYFMSIKKASPKYLPPPFPRGGGEEILDLTGGAGFINIIKKEERRRI